MGRIKRAYLKCEEVGEVYEASQHTIITRKPVFPSSAGGCRTVSTVGPSSPQNCQTGAEEQPKKEMVKDGKERREGGKQSNPITIRPGSLTPVELTPPPSATKTRPASLSKYSHLDFSFQFYRRIFNTEELSIEKNTYKFGLHLMRKISKFSRIFSS